jgi:LacI family transcriptional regulator
VDGLEVDSEGAGSRDGAGAYRGRRLSALPTIYDVAAKAGVSIATVSRVLNDQEAIRPLTRDRVLKAVRELSYVPDGAAKGLSRGHKHVVGLMFANTPADDDLSSEEELNLLFTDSVIRGAEWSANRLGYSLLLSGIPAGADRLRAVRALSAKVDGLILLDRVVAESQVSSLTKRCPVVLLAGSGRCADALTVRADNEGGMRAVAEHLVNEHGRRRAWFVAAYPDSPDSAIRAAAFCSAMADLGGDCDAADVLSADWTASGAARVLQQRLTAGGELPAAIACANDQMAIGAVHALTAASVRVPEDVAVIGFDDIQVARYLTPPLTTVRQPSRELGASAVDSLVGAVRGRALTPHAAGVAHHPAYARRPVDVVLPTQLVIRNSCGCPTPREAI